MKRRFVLAIAAVLLIALAACLVTACDPAAKENSDVTVTFDRNGVGENVTLSGAPGTDISENLPKPNSTQAYYFGGWYDNAALDGDAVDLPSELPSESTTYFARWYRKYSVNFYVQDDKSKEYALAETLSFEADKGVDSVTVSASDFQKYDIYQNVSEQGDNATLQLDSRDGGVVDFKFDLIYRNVNYILGEAEDEHIAAQAINGFEFLPDNGVVDVEKYMRAGKRFLGFSLSEGGELVDSLTVFEDVDLYALWDEAYVERNGSNDLLYVDGDKAYLMREFVDKLEGSFNSDTKMFSFLEGALVGRVYDDGTFATQRDGAVPFYLYDAEQGDMIDGVELSLDWLDGATLKIGQEGADMLATLSDVGGVPTLVKLPAGEYECTYRADMGLGDYFVTVPLADGDVDVHFLTGEYESEDGEKHDVFLPRGIEFGMYDDEDATLFLDGYGTAYYIVEEGYILGEYAEVQIDEELSDETEIMASFDSGSVFLLMHEFTSFDEGIPCQNMNRYDGTSGNFSQSDPFTHQGGYGELYVSGYGFALLGNNSKTRYDYEIQLNGMLTPYGVNWLKLYDSETHEYKKDVFFSENPNYYFEMPSGAEFKFIVDFYAPTDMLYFASDTEVHYFTYDYDFETLMYNLGDDGVLAEAGLDAQGRKLYSVTFSDSDMNFKYFEVETDGVVTCYREGTLVYNGDYTAADGSTLVLNGYGEAIYTGLDGIAHYGRYYNVDGGTTFACDDEECTIVFDFNIKADAFEIVEYTDMPSDMLYHFVLMQDASGQQYLTYNALMTVAQNLDASIEIPLSEDESITVSGKISLADPINSYFLFTVKEVSGTYPNSFVETLSHDFLFSLIGYNTQQGDMYGFALSDGFEKMYTLKDGSVFTMDGFGLATYRDADGNGSFGAYEVLHETSYIMGMQHIHYIFDFIDVNGNETLFDLWDDGSLTKRGDEYSWYGYYIYDGVNYYNYLIFPDGNGNLDFVYYDDGMLYMATAKYALDGDIGTMTDVEYTVWAPMDGFTQEECDVLNLLAVWLQEQFEIYEGETYGFKLVKVDGEDCFMILDEGVKDAFVFGDKSVLETDGFNEAVYTDKYGDSYGGTFVAEFFSANEGETLMTLIRFKSDYIGEKAFLITDEMSLEVGVEFGNYHAEDDSVFLDGRGAVTYTFGGVTNEGTYAFDAETGIVFVTPKEGDDFKIKVKVNGNARTYVICDESLAGEYSEVDMKDEPADSDAVLTMDGMGSAQIMEDGVLTRYDVAHVELTVYRLTNVLDATDTIDVKLDFDAHTFKRSDGLMAMEETQWFDFAGDGQVHTDVLMSIDSFYIVRLNGEVFGTLDSYEQFDVNSRLYNVTKSDGSKTSYVRSLAGRFPNGAGYYGYAYMEYDAKSNITLNDAYGLEAPIVLTGYGLGDIDGKSYNYRTAVYWFEGEMLCVAGVYDAPTQGYKMYTVDYDAKTYTVYGDNDKNHFTVENGVLTAYTGKSVKVIIPTDMGIKEIGEGVFSYAVLGFYVQSIDLSDVVEIVGKRAFYPEKATSTTADTVCEVTGTAKLRIIREEAFYLADIKSIELPAIELVETKAFYGTTTLENVVLGNNVESWNIGDSAFVSGSSLPSSKHFTVTITAPHAPLIGVNAFNKADVQENEFKSNMKYIKFTQATAWAEAQDEGTEIGASWAQYFAETAVTYTLSGPDETAGVSLEESGVDAYFEEKRK